MTEMSVRSVLLLIAVVALMAACKPEQSGEPEAAGDSAPARAVTSSAVEPRIEACRIHMTLPAEHRWTSWWDPHGVEPTGESPSSAHSVYWASAREKETLHANRTAMPLDINCSDPGPPGIRLSLAAISSGERDMPLGAGTYPIVGKSGGEVKPGEVLAGPLSFDQREYDATGGTLVIDRFDMEGVAGSFRIEAIDSLAPNRSIRIEGSFAIPCHGGMLETECRANKLKATAAREPAVREPVARE